MKSRIVNTKRLKLLNLYSGIGGNVYKLDRAQFEITSIENNPKVAAVYQELNPDDEIIITDALNYLKQHFKKFDIIWMSPPCQTHSKLQHSQRKRVNRSVNIIDPQLWQCILFGYQHLNDQSIIWIVENVEPWYNKYWNFPHVKLGRHYYYSNANFHNISTKNPGNFSKMNLAALIKFHGLPIDDNIMELIRSIDRQHPRVVLRNCVHPGEAAQIMQQLIKPAESLEVWI